MSKRKQVNLYEAKTQLSQLVKEAAAGATIIIAKGGEPMAQLLPLGRAGKPIRKPGLWAGQGWIADDFDAPLPADVEALFEGTHSATLGPNPNLEEREKKSS